MNTQSRHVIGIAGLLWSGVTMFAATPVHTEHPASSHNQKATSGMMGVTLPEKNPAHSIDSTRSKMDMPGMMKKMSMNPTMMARGKMMMHTTIDQGDPAALLSLAEKLGLNVEQQAALKEIVANARADARKVLTDSQRTVLDEIPAGPSSMAQMHATMMENMRTMSSGNGDHDMSSACPMMTTMLSGEAGSTSRNSTTVDHASHSGH